MTIAGRHPWGWAGMAPAVAGAIFMSSLSTLGCARAEDDGPTPPKSVTFEGKVDSRFVGSWRTADGHQGLDLRQNGDAKILASQPTPHGYSKSTLDGQWLASNDDLLLKYKDHSEEIIIKYKTILSDGSLTVSMMGGRLKTKYLKKR